MIKIAICDDDEMCREQVITFLRQYAKEHNDRNFVFQSFSSGKQLLNHISEHGNFDIYILDVIMPEVNGIKTGMILRRYDDTGKVIYLTSTPEYGVESYMARAYNYLLKPVDYDKISAVMEAATEQIRKENQKSIIIRTHENVLKVPFDSILYAELVKRSVIYHLAGGGKIETLTIRVPFAEEVEPLTADSRFIICGASMIVNLYHVTAVEKDTLVMTGDIRVYVPKKYSNDIRSRWLDFWLEAGGV